MSTQQAGVGEGSFGICDSVSFNSAQEWLGTTRHTAAASGSRFEGNQRVLAVSSVLGPLTQPQCLVFISLVHRKKALAVGNPFPPHQGAARAKFS
jgi:hypothetical protein